MQEHLFVSPHFDDAVGSCGGTIARLVGAGHTVRILTVFGGLEREPFSLPAKILHDEWKLQRPVMYRRMEDAAAGRLLGCRTSFLHFSDAIYRQGGDGQHLYPTFESLRGPLAREDDQVANRIAAAILERLPSGHTVIYCPLAIGAHVDHVLVRDSGRALLEQHSSVVFYRDFYYDLESTADPGDLIPSRVDVALTPLEIEQKRDAFSSYSSQISDLFGSQADMTSYFQGIGSVESIFLAEQAPSPILTDLWHVLKLKGDPT